VAPAPTARLAPASPASRAARAYQRPAFDPLAARGVHHDGLRLKEWGTPEECSRFSKATDRKAVRKPPARSIELRGERGCSVYYCVTIAFVCQSRPTPPGRIERTYAQFKEASLEPVCSVAHLVTYSHPVLGFSGHRVSPEVAPSSAYRRSAISGHPAVSSSSRMTQPGISRPHHPATAHTALRVCRRDRYDRCETFRQPDSGGSYHVLSR
jgi:hypothetical protein